MPLMFSFNKKTLMFESIKIGEESIKLIGYIKGSKEFQFCLRVRNLIEFSQNFP